MSSHKVNTIEWHDENIQQNRHFIEEGKKFMRSLTQQAQQSGGTMDNEQTRLRQQNQRFLQQVMNAALEDVEADTRDYETECNQARKSGEQQFQRGQRGQKAA